MTEVTSFPELCAQPFLDVRYVVGLRQDTAFARIEVPEPHVRHFRVPQLTQSIQLWPIALLAQLGLEEPQPCAVAELGQLPLDRKSVV